MSGITWAGAKAFREFAFPSQVADKAHDPWFSTTNALDWVSPEAYEVFHQQKDQEDDTSMGGDGEASEMGDVDIVVLKAYKKFILTEKYHNHPFFDLDDLEIWFKPAAFRKFRPFLQVRPTRSRANSSASEYPPSSRPSSRMSIFEFESEYPEYSRPSSRMSTTMASDHDLAPPPPVPQREPPTKRATQTGPASQPSEVIDIRAMMRKSYGSLGSRPARS
ncbi:hypothetical protein DFP72DRAFT_595157 [Ephemerocybe angulata]|uniref:Uncharacterized protein n=1 Tax=Ephemerocybe angulata TaxID=980116 RepID=A0A8H6MFE5_9AGAR|nr:hypothetical protein DFP72DRAFT_595157 [Tulosesus angulatus]